MDFPPRSYISRSGEGLLTRGAQATVGRHHLDQQIHKHYIWAIKYTFRGLVQIGGTIYVCFVFVYPYERIYFLHNKIGMLITIKVCHDITVCFYFYFLHRSKNRTCCLLAHRFQGRFKDTIHADFSEKYTSKKEKSTFRRGEKCSGETLFFEGQCYFCHDGNNATIKLAAVAVAAVIAK